MSPEESSPKTVKAMLAMLRIQEKHCCEWIQHMNCQLNVSHTLSILKSVISQQKKHCTNFNQTNHFSMDFILQNPGGVGSLSNPVPQDMHLLQLNPLKWVLPRFSGEPPGCFPLPFAPSCGLEPSWSC